MKESVGRFKKGKDVGCDPPFLKLCYYVARNYSLHLNFSETNAVEFDVDVTL